MVRCDHTNIAWEPSLIREGLIEILSYVQQQVQKKRLMIIAQDFPTST